MLSHFFFSYKFYGTCVCEKKVIEIEKKSIANTFGILSSTLLVSQKQNNRIVENASYKKRKLTQQDDFP